jgi:hypothetical protein
MWRLPADFWIALEKGLQHLPQDIKESTSPTLPIQISVSPIRNHLREPFQEQNSIKWTNLLKGCMPQKWQQFATAHVRSKKLDLRARLRDRRTELQPILHRFQKNTLNPQIRSKTLDMIVRNTVQPSRNSF